MLGSQRRSLNPRDAMNISAIRVEKHLLLAFDVQFRRSSYLIILCKPMNSQLRNSPNHQFGHQLMKDWTGNSSIDNRGCRSGHSGQILRRYRVTVALMRSGHAERHNMWSRECGLIAILNYFNSDYQCLRYAESHGFTLHPCGTNSPRRPRLVPQNGSMGGLYI